MCSTSLNRPIHFRHIEPVRILRGYGTSRVCPTSPSLSVFCSDKGWHQARTSLSYGTWLCSPIAALGREEIKIKMAIVGEAQQPVVPTSSSCTTSRSTAKSAILVPEMDHHHHLYVEVNSFHSNGFYSPVGYSTRFQAVEEAITMGYSTRLQAGDEAIIIGTINAAGNPIYRL